MTLGEKIWRLREGKGMSQDALAEALGVSRQTISNWENDKATLDAEKLQRLCAVFCVSVDEFLSGDGVPAAKAPSAHEKTPVRRKSGILSAVFAALAAVFLVTAVLGLLFTDLKSSEASIYLYPSAIWGGFFVLGGCTLVVAAILFFKRK